MFLSECHLAPKRRRLCRLPVQPQYFPAAAAACSKEIIKLEQADGYDGLLVHLREDSEEVGLQLGAASDDDGGARDGAMGAVSVGDAGGVGEMNWKCSYTKFFINTSSAKIF